MVMSSPVDPGLLPSAPVLPQTFFRRPARRVAPDLLGCALVVEQPGGERCWGLVVETEAYAQCDPACHGHDRRSPANETLFGPPGHLYVYLTYGIHHCVNVVTDRDGRAGGVLLRALLLPGAEERAAAGPGLLARCCGLDRRHDGLPLTPVAGVWLVARPAAVTRLLEQERSRGLEPVVCTTRIGVSRGRELEWRWYLRGSRSVSRRVSGDRRPRLDELRQAIATTVCP